MAKTRIQTNEPSNFGRTVMFNTGEITFDKLGFAEVDSEVADKLVEDYKGWLFKEEAPKKEKKKVETTEDMKKYEEEIDRLKGLLEDREAKLKMSEEEVKEWKNQVEILKSGKEKAEFDLSEHMTQNKKIIDELTLKCQLQSKTVAQLVDVCKSMEINEEKYKDLTKKDEIINLILDESRQ